MGGGCLGPSSDKKKWNYTTHGFFWAIISDLGCCGGNYFKGLPLPSHVSVCGLEASQKIIIRFLSKMIIHASNETLI